MYSQILRESGNYGCVLLFMEKKIGRKFKVFYNFYINFYFLFLSLYINLIRKVKVNPFLYFVFFNVRSSTLKNKYRYSKEIDCLSENTGYSALKWLNLGL